VPITQEFQQSRGPAYVDQSPFPDQPLTSNDFPSTPLTSLPSYTTSTAQTVHEALTPSFICPYCDRACRDQIKLTRHLRKHTGPMSCPRPGCREGQDFGNSLRRHVWTKHAKWAKETNYPPLEARCDWCDSSFARADGLKRHQDNSCKKRFRV